MITLHNLKLKIKRKARKRVGRGPSSGHGGYSGRGIKGQKARTGGRIRPGFEGGRMPLIRQFPKIRGFRSIYPKNQVVSLSVLARKFDEGAMINPAVLAEKGLVKSAKQPVKILGKEKIARKFTFEKVELSAAAKELVIASGGIILPAKK